MKFAAKRDSLLALLGSTPNFFLNPNFFFAYGLGLMHVTGSLPAKNWASLPTGLGGVVVSASLAPQQ
jgi:hypothetical protein